MQRTIVQFERHLQQRYPKSSTAKHYISDLRAFSRSIKHKSPAKVVSQDVDRFIEQQVSAQLANSTINRRLDAIHALFEYLANFTDEQAFSNPVIARRHRLKRRSHLPRDASDHDVTLLFATMEQPRDVAMFGLMVGAGLRVGEVVSLRIEDVQAPEAGQLAKLRVSGKGGKERTVWLIPSLWRKLQSWLKTRPTGTSAHLFLNQHRRALSVSGIQFRLKQHCKSAGVSLSCHQLRHTFARRLVENGLPVDSLAKLLGHEYLQTTQRYIDGANPRVKADFEAVMLKLEAPIQPARASWVPTITPATASRKPSPTALQKLLGSLHELPVWMKPAYDEYLTWRWPTWRAQTAYTNGRNLMRVGQKIGEWLTEQRQVTSWQTLKRVDLEAWVKASCEMGKTAKTIQNYLDQFRMLLKLLEDRDYVLNPGLFRVKAPKGESRCLPRYLSETEYHRLEAVVMKGLDEDVYGVHFDRAWFLTLAHTGVRVSELLDLRMEDLKWEEGYLTVRGGKPGRDRVVYLTPELQGALEKYLGVRPQSDAHDHVFLLHDRPTTARTIQRRLATYGRKAKVHVSPHRLRHTLATRLINKGMAIHTLQKLLGHQKLSTTQIYAYVYDETVYQQFRTAMSWAEKPLQSRMGRVVHRSLSDSALGEKNLGDSV